jgi:hypothetical protein
MTDNSTNPPPTPNPMFDGANRYPRPETGINWPLIDATLEFIAALPVALPADVLDGDVSGDGRAWVQESWRCGTGMCFAGWASALTGAVFPYAAENTSDGVECHGDRFVSASMVVRAADGENWAISDYAQHMLGLDTGRYSLGGGWYDTPRLFAGANTLEDIRDIVDEMRAEYDEDES